MKPTQYSRGGSRPRVRIESIFTRTINGWEVKKPWLDIGQTYNEETGVDQVVAKKVKDNWVYVQIEWHFQRASIGFIIKDGVLYD